MERLAFTAPDSPLFAPAAIAAKEDIRADPTVVRSRLVAIAEDQLQDARSNAPMGRGRLRLNFFPDADFSLLIDRKEVRSQSDFTLFARVEGLALGHCTLVVQDGKLTGNCSSPQGTYQVRWYSDGLHIVREIDQSKFPPEAEPIELPSTESGEGAEVESVTDPDPLKDGGVHPDEAVADDDGTIVDILVVYTPAARIASRNILGEIRLAIDETNQAYINSGALHRVRLVGTSEVSYTESGILCNDPNSDLTRLSGTSDGYMDNVHSLRDAYGADQVTLIVNTANSCGCAYFMTTVSTDFESAAFSVVRRDCSTGYFSFGHELGHNMSARHDCYVDPVLTPYNHVHGYVHLSTNPDLRWRTIMAYNNQCEDNGYYCNRIQYFSNPTVTYLGAPTGTTGTGCTANVQLTFANTDLTVSRFRDGFCYRTGFIERVLAHDDSYNPNNYIYIRPSATTGWYQYFITRDDNLAEQAVAAMRRRVDVRVRGNQSCFDNAYDFGGNIDYLIINP
jgi:hypothetical protein